jgi:tetratricopeptide (TPR) repeat protein
MNTGKWNGMGGMLLTALCASWAAASTAEWTEGEDLRIWRQPEFQRRFMGTYGIHSEVEPTIPETEREDLEKVMELMGQPNGPRLTRSYIASLDLKAVSAVFDFTLANLYFQEEKLEASAHWYERAIGKHPSYRRAFKNLGMVYVRLGEYQKAADALTRAIALGDHEGTSYGLLGYSHAMREELTSAEGAYRQAVMLQPDVLDWRLGLAKTLFRQQRYEEAAVLCGELMEAYPDQPDYWLLQANAYLGMKEPLRAAVNYEYLHLAGKATAQSMNTLGDIYVNEGVMDMAADAYLAALRLDQDQRPDLFLRDAEILLARAAYDDAERLLKAVEEKYGADLAAEHRKRKLKMEARLAAIRGTSGEEHVALLKQIAELDPLDGEALILLAQHYVDADDFERAVFYFERAQGIEETEAVACLRHAQALVREGRFDDALPLLKRSQQIEPREDVATYLEQVEKAAKMRGG